MNKVLFSSKSILWETPQAFSDSLNQRYCFTTDVCAVKQNAKCRHFYTPQEDGLKQQWRGRCWMNPPYGREIGKWLENAYQESLKGCLVVALLPARTDTRWYHQFINNQANVTVKFLQRRIKFVITAILLHFRVCLYVLCFFKIVLIIYSFFKHKNQLQ